MVCLTEMSWFSSSRYDYSSALGQSRENRKVQMYFYSAMEFTNFYLFSLFVWLQCDSLIGFLCEFFGGPTLEFSNTVDAVWIQTSCHSRALNLFFQCLLVFPLSDFSLPTIFCVPLSHRKLMYNLEVFMLPQYNNLNTLVNQLCGITQNIDFYIND